MSNRAASVGRVVGRRLLVGLAACLMTLWAPMASGQERGDRETEAAQIRIHEMFQEAQRLQGRGRHEAAGALIEEAEQMRQELHRHLEDREAEAHHRHLMEVLEHLEHGMVALRELERFDVLEELERIADDVRKEIRDIEVRHERAEAGHARGGDREQIVHEIEAMRLAVHAFLEAEQHEAADFIERAIGAREMQLEARRDPEAARIGESAPPRREVVELMMVASRLWAEFGHEHKSEVVGEVARVLADRLGRERRGQRDMGSGGADRDRRSQRERRELEAQRSAAGELRREERAARERGGPSRNEDVDHLRRRIDEIEQHLAELAEALEQTHDMLRELHREQR